MRVVAIGFNIINIAHSASAQHQFLVGRNTSTPIHIYFESFLSISNDFWMRKQAYTLTVVFHISLTFPFHVHPIIYSFALVVHKPSRTHTVCTILITPSMELFLVYEIGVFWTKDKVLAGVLLGQSMGIRRYLVVRRSTSWSPTLNFRDTKIGTRKH